MIIERVASVCLREVNNFKERETRQTLATGERKTYPATFYVFWEYYERWRPNHCHRGIIAKSKLESYVIEACELLFMKPDLWEQHAERPDDLIERWQSHVMLCEKQIKEIDAQMEELLQLALQQRSPRTRELFNQKQVELEEQRERYNEQLQIARDRVRTAEDMANQRDVIEGHLKQIKELGGISSLPYEVKRAVLTRLIDEITAIPKSSGLKLRGR